ncbi:MAG: protein YqgE [Frankiales bacterium]|nr:protein YqgE [Frankiales bacterium]
MSGWEGRLLVATPSLDGGGLDEAVFSRTVVQILQHSEEDGALGVVLNRPTGTDLADVLPGWGLLAPDPVVVFEGGPVQQTAAICLGRLTAAATDDPSYVMVEGAPWLGTVDLDVDAADALEEVRVFAGYAGWSPGQLEAEVEEGAWWVLDALPGDCFTSEPELLWRQVLRRQGLPLSLAASYPPDPMMN